MTATALSPSDIRKARLDSPTERPRDLADRLGIAEASLCAAHVGLDADGFGVTRIATDLDRLMPMIEALGEVMGLTRNDNCVIEKVGVYEGYRPGAHAALVVNENIDLRLFPAQWMHGFAVVEQGPKGIKRSIQVFDAAGDAIHKVHLRAASNLDAWARLVADLRLDDQSDSLTLSPRKPVEAAKANPDRADELRRDWDQMTDTHQFLRLTARLKMNRLGAYRIAGVPYARPLAQGSVEALMHQAAECGVPTMFFVGNMGCIEIHTGPIKRVVEMGPWINVLDPGFDLHLRMDKIAETYAVVKNTGRGPAHSVECFDARGELIAQIFGVLRGSEAEVAQWNALVAGLPDRAVMEAAQ